MHIIKFMGGFANQLFQLAMYYSVKEKHDDVYADLSHYKTNNDHGGYKLDKFISLNIIEIIPDNAIVVNEINYNDIIFDQKKDYYYVGYWQDEEYFPKNRDIFFKIFDVSGLKGKNKEYYDKITNAEYSVSVHVRRGDYINNYVHGDIANYEYFINSIEYVCGRVSNPTFFVFSDDLNWCKESFDFQNNSVIYVEGNEQQVHFDILLMSLCNCNIISNSSFSWWAKSINKKQDKLVIAPEYWFNEEMNTKPLYIGDAVKIPNYLYRKCPVIKPEFTICIPAYNVAVSIRRCLSSVLNQTFEDIEVIIVDDGSTDDTFEIISSYQKNDNRIKLIKNERNRSLLYSRIVAMKQGTGNYFLFVDADDYIERELCEVLHKKYKNEGFFDVIEFDNICEPEKLVVGPRYFYSEPEDWLRALLKFEIFHTVWTRCYSKFVIERLLTVTDGFYCNMNEGLYFSCVFMYYCRKFSRVEKVLYHYMTENGMPTNNEITTDKLVSHIDSITTCIAQLLKFFKKEDIQMEKELDISRAKSLDFIYRMCIKSDSVYNRLVLLKQIDEKCGTNYKNDYEKEIEIGLKIKQEFIDVGIKRKVYIILKMIKERLFNKI